MITNIVATIVVCIVTNAPVITDNSRAPSQVTYGCLVVGCTDDHSDKGAPATERTETTVIKEVTTLTFEFNGDNYTAVSKKRIKSIVRKFKLNPKQWVEQ